MRETLRTTKNSCIARPVCFRLAVFFCTSARCVIKSALKLWLKADAGTSTTTDGNPVTSWLDNSPFSNTITGWATYKQ